MSFVKTERSLSNSIIKLYRNFMNSAVKFHTMRYIPTAGIINKAEVPGI